MSPSLSVPGSIFPSPHQPASVPGLPPAMNTGGSLPDLTSLHFPPPLPTPLDPEEMAYPSLSGGNSTSNLTHTLTHLGISGGLGPGAGYDAPGEQRSRLEGGRGAGGAGPGASCDRPRQSSPGLPHGRRGFLSKGDGGQPPGGPCRPHRQGQSREDTVLPLHRLVAALCSGQKAARPPSVTLASVLLVCACRTPVPSQPPVLAVLPEQPQPPGLPERPPAPAAGLPQPPLPAGLLPGPPCTARHLPGPPLAQCPGPVLLQFLLRFGSRAGCPPLPAFDPRNLPPPPSCAPQPPEFARGPS